MRYELTERVGELVAGRVPLLVGAEYYRIAAPGDYELFNAAVVADADPRVEQVLLCTPDKDLAQCVIGSRIVTLDRRRGIWRDADGVREKFGVGPESIPDYLALVGDAAREAPVEQPRRDRRH